MKILQIAKQVIQTEIEGLEFMSSRLDEQITAAVESILETKGRVIICGMGKSGIIGKKIAASFASTGTPSFFMHPGEAFHGDLGMVTSDDVFIAISNSGETDEVLKLLPFLRDNKNYVIAVTGNENSTLAKYSHCHLNISVPKEACNLQLAPTSSTTATLVMGDILTVALMQLRNFQPENFARFHPGGSLGRKLLSTVRDEMFKGELPIVDENASLTSVINVISTHFLGLTLVQMKLGKYAIITDGDLRRSMEKNGKSVFDLKAKDIVSIEPKTISPEVKLEVAYQKMLAGGISSLLVIENERVIGILKK